MLRISRMVFRNVTLSRRAECLIRCRGNYIEIVLFPARPWKVQAGERVNLWVPSAGLFSLFQMHPFVVAWWDNKDMGSLASITLLVRPRFGFTSRLKDLSDTRHAAWIDGPYGPNRIVNMTRSKIPDFGHLFMIATGIGVAAQIPYMKQLVEGYRHGAVRTQRITLIWQLDEAGKSDDVHSMSGTDTS
jgi:predicted ferric reductase